MPLRLPCKPVTLSPGGLLHSYWGATGFHRPAFDVHVVGPGGQVRIELAQADTGSDYVLFAAPVAHFLGLVLPFPRQVPFSGAAGTQAGALSFPPDGVVSLFVTDYREYCYLPAPPVGFHPPGPNAANQRSVLGLTGFLQHFLFIHDPRPPRPMVELHPLEPFPGQAGPLPLDRPLFDFIRELRGP
jgi:hypothetical protein